MQQFEQKIREKLAEITDYSRKPMGILPRVIKDLVERRKNVKNLLRNVPINDTAKRMELDIKQKAIKLVANSMYGCLGFGSSRFYAKTIAAMITSTGRKLLEEAL
jgi:DNA polymerase alpha subunit A